MNVSKFQLLDSYFDARLLEPRQDADVADWARRARRMSQRLNDLAYPVFCEFAEYFAAKLGDAAECYVDREEGLSRDAPPHVGFRWGAQGGRLNAVVFTGDIESGEVHATWRCWRNGIPAHGDKTLDPFWSPELVHSMLQELIFQFPPV
jgi:hypothetical protein